MNNTEIILSNIPVSKIRPVRALILHAILLSSVIFLIGCTGGKYGFKKNYVPNSDEKEYHNTSTEFSFTAVTQSPADYQDKTIAWFGVVKTITLTDDGRYLVMLNHHLHKKRHLCKTESVSSCRVTINKSSSGTFSVLLPINPEDLAPGLEKIQPMSLLRVFGTVRCRSVPGQTEPNCDHNSTGGVLLDGIFYRHWPKRYYVTTQASSTMIR